MLGTLVTLRRFRPLRRGLLTDLKQEIKELLALSYSFLIKVLPSQNLK